MVYHKPFVFRALFYQDNTEIDHQAETEASTPNRNLIKDYLMHLHFPNIVAMLPRKTTTSYTPIPLKMI